MTNGMKWLVGVIGLSMLAGVYPVLGEEAKVEGTAPAKTERVKGTRPALTEMTVTGMVTKSEQTGKAGKTFTVYTLTDAAGAKVMLSSGDRRGQGKDAPEVAPVNLGAYVDKNVTVTGKGFTMEHGDTKVTRIVQITKIEVVEAKKAE